MILGCTLGLPSSKDFSAHLMKHSVAIFGHSRVFPTERGYETGTQLRLANQNAGNLITEVQRLISGNIIFILRPLRFERHHFVADRSEKKVYTGDECCGKTSNSRRFMKIPKRRENRLWSAQAFYQHKNLKQT